MENKKIEVTWSDLLQLGMMSFGLIFYLHGSIITAILCLIVIILLRFSKKFRNLVDYGWGNKK